MAWSTTVTLLMKKCVNGKIVVLLRSMSEISPNVTVLTMGLFLRNVLIVFNMLYTVVIYNYLLFF